MTFFASALAPVLFLAPVDSAPAPDATRVVLGASADVVASSLSFGPSAATANGIDGGGTVGATFYPWAPLVDDESPRALQAFLQRTSNVAVGLRGYGEAFSNSAAAGGGGSATASFGAEASVRYFFTHSLAIFGGAGGDVYSNTQSPARGNDRADNVWAPYGNVGVDARSGDASLTLEWEVLGATDQVTSGVGPLPPPDVFWPRLTLGGRTVLDRRFDLSADAGLIPDGATGSVAFGFYATKDLGLSLFARYDRGQIYVNQATDYDRLEGGPKAAYWLTPRVEISLAYTPEWISERQGDEVRWRHDVTVGVAVRAW
jgi:hypothetical protein